MLAARAAAVPRRPPTSAPSPRPNAGMRDGTLLTGEVLARWQDCVVGGDLRPRRGGKAARSGGGRKGKRARRGLRRITRRWTPRCVRRSSLTSCRSRIGRRSRGGGWRAEPAGSVLLADAVAERARESAPSRCSSPPSAGIAPLGQSGARRPGPSADHQGRRTGSRPPTAGPRRSLRLPSADPPGSGAARHAGRRGLAGPPDPASQRDGPAACCSPAHLLRRRGAGPGGPGGDARRGSTRWGWDCAGLGAGPTGAARTLPAGIGPRPAGAAVSAEADGGSVYTEPRRMLTSVFGRGDADRDPGQGARRPRWTGSGCCLTRSWSGSLRCSTRPGPATTSRPSGSTRRNSRSRRLGDSEHDRGRPG